MCTVTFLPVRHSYYITSNRDEKRTRSRAMAPAIYRENDKLLIYPKDADRGGSWIAMHENGNAAVLLNGAFERHVPTPPYRASRGMILLDIIGRDRPLLHFSAISLDSIEPFTLVLLDTNCLYDCRWDGIKKHFKQLKNHRPYIWSSATLYKEEVIEKRERWFASFLNRTARPIQQDIINFHKFTGDGDQKNDLLMSRDDQYATVSITSIHLTADRASMKYFDLEDGSTMEKKIELESTMAHA